MTAGHEIRLIEEDGGWWPAVDERSGVTSQGPSRRVPLENLDGAVTATEEAREVETTAPDPLWFGD